MRVDDQTEIAGLPSTISVFDPERHFTDAPDPVASGSVQIPDASVFFASAWNRAVHELGLKAIQENDSLLDPYRAQAQREYEQSRTSAPVVTTSAGDIVTNPGYDPNLSKTTGTGGTDTTSASLAATPVVTPPTPAAGSTAAAQADKGAAAVPELSIPDLPIFSGGNWLGLLVIAGLFWLAFHLKKK